MGGSFEDHYTRSIDVGGKLMTVPNLFSLANVEPASGKRDQGYLRTRNVAFFASAELGWKNMLYLSATGRCDWASSNWSAMEILPASSTPPSVCQVSLAKW